jgi:hypothetical protein
VKKGANEMTPDFLGRIFKTSLNLSIGLAILAAWYLGVPRGVDFGIAALWGSVNFRFLARLVLEGTRPEGSRMTRVLAALALKFPLLYGAGIAWAVFRKPDAVATFAGLSLILMVILLKSIGRGLVDANWFTRPLPRGGEGR